MSAAETEYERMCRELKQELRIFRFLDEEDFTRLRGYLGCRRLRAGETLWREGDQDDAVVFVASGRLEELKQTEFADHQVVVGVYGPGAIIGAFSLLEEQPRAFTARALEESGLLVLARENFERVLSAHPDTGVRLLKGMLSVVTHRLQKAFERLATVF